MGTENIMDVDNEVKTCLTRFVSDKGEELPGGLLDVPVNIEVKSLESIVNNLLVETDPVPLAFFINGKEVVKNLKDSFDKDFNISENVIEIVYQPQAIFKVRAVTRCTASLEGHKEAVISVAFSPNGQSLASGSGDTTVRCWDIHTQTPLYTLQGHKHWVLCISWSPNGQKLASGCKNGMVMIWDPETGKQIGKTLVGHKSWITSLAWEPYHTNPESRLLASSSKDGDIRIWDTIRSQTVRVLAGHTKGVTCIRWGGRGLIYSGSQDRTIKVWRAEDGVLCRTLQGHAHWVNTLALNVDYVLRTGPYKIIRQATDPTDQVELAKSKYEEMGKEKLVSGSDDFTLFLWNPETDKQPIARMTGHQQLINDVKFSPNGFYIASASFDKSIKIWDANTGKYVGSLRGHVQAVYSIAWSADSRLLLSGSADSTLKVWNMKTLKLQQDLPGHADEVYAVDWAPDSIRVASGGKDKVLKLWQN